jgi:hypothetical protein
VLKAFVEKFGVEMGLGGKSSHFFDCEPFPKRPDLKFTIPAGNYFGSISFADSVDDPEIVRATAYAIDVARYKLSLRPHGVTL